VLGFIGSSVFIEAPPPSLFDCGADDSPLAIGTCVKCNIQGTRADVEIHATCDESVLKTYKRLAIVNGGLYLRTRSQRRELAESGGDTAPNSPCKRPKTQSSSLEHEEDEDENVSRGEYSKIRYTKVNL
jgi:hypothetical protein